MTIISPHEGERLTDNLPPGQTLYTPLILLLSSNYEDDKIARVFVNGIGPAFCTLSPNKAKDCGQVPLMKQGDQVIRVEIDIFADDQIYSTQSDMVTFLWDPYGGWWDLTALNVANSLGKDSPVFGYRLFSLILVIGLSLLGYIFTRRSILVAGIAGWIGLLILTVTFSLVDSLVAHAVAWYFAKLCLVFLVLGAVIYLLVARYQESKKTVRLPDTEDDDDTWEEAGRRKTEVREYDVSGKKSVPSAEYLPSPKIDDPEDDPEIVEAEIIS